MRYYTWENFGREKLANLANHELFAKFCLPKFIDALKIYLAYALTVAHLSNFSYVQYNGIHSFMETTDCKTIMPQGLKYTWLL